MNSTGNGNSARGAIPELIYPAIKWDESDYASLQVRLELYEDFVVLSKFDQGEVKQQFIVDPIEVAAVLAGINLTSGLLPREVLFWSKSKGADRLGVYIAPQVWPVVVRGETEAWRVPLPGLVFVGREYDYSVWAVEGRPVTRDVQLYMAPCPNVYPEGVCRGNAPFPKAGPATIWQAVDVFFSSRFNRDLSNQKSKAHPDCVLDQWWALYETEAETYPLGDLVGTNLTVGRLIDDG